MANPAVIADLTTRWRALNAQETINGQTFLDDAWGMLKRRFIAAGADLEELVTDDADGFADEVVRVIATAVLRVMKNADGKRKESVDDYSWERDESIAAGVLYFSEDEMNDLLPGAPAKGRAYMIDPLAGRDWDDWS